MTKMDVPSASHILSTATAAMGANGILYVEVPTEVDPNDTSLP